MDHREDAELDRQYCYPGLHYQCVLLLVLAAGYYVSHRGVVELGSVVVFRDGYHLAGAVCVTWEALQGAEAALQKGVMKIRIEKFLRTTALSRAARPVFNLGALTSLSRGPLRLLPIWITLAHAVLQIALEPEAGTETGRQQCISEWERSLRSAALCVQSET